MSFPRYPEYRDSGVEWLGNVPAHWDVAPFKRMVSLQNGADHKHIECEDGYPVIGSGGPFACATEYMHDGESVLLGRKGTIDKPLYVTGRFWTVDTMYWSKIQPGAYGRFAYYSALTIPFGYYSTNTALPSMTKSVLEAHLLATPPESEQKAIAAFLDHETAKIDALVAEQEKLIELLKEKRQAVISHAVTKGLDPSVPMKDSGVEWLGEVPAHWTIAALNFRYEVLLGKMLDEKKISGNHLAPYLRNVDVQWDRINIDELPQMDFDGSEVERYGLRAGDLLVCEGGDVGRSATWKGELTECYYQKALHRLRPRDGSSDLPRFQFYLMQAAAKREVFTGGQGKATIAHLTAEALRRYRFAYPPRAEQEQIVENLDEAVGRFDELISEAASASQLLQERRSALISAAVTGQIDVRAFAQTEAA